MKTQLLHGIAVLVLAALFAQVAGAAAGAECQGWIADDKERLAPVVTLMEERLRAVEAVARDKWRRSAAIRDESRERLVLESAARGAARFGLSSGPVRDLFALQMDLARSYQARRFAEFAHHDPGENAGLSIDVARERINDINQELLQALYLAAPVFDRGPATADMLHAATAQSEFPELRESSAAARLAAILAQTRRDRRGVLARVRASGVLQIGVAGDYPPFAWSDQRACLHGSDIEAMHELAAALGVRAQFVRTSWLDLVQDLGQERFDIAAGGVSVTAERAASGVFSLPYHHGGKTAIARCSDAGRFDSWEKIDKQSTRLVVNPGGTNERYVREHVRHAPVRVFADNLRIFDQILTGAADVMITDDVEVELQVARHSELCRVLPGLLSVSEKAYYLPPDPQWQQYVNQWLGGRLADAP